MTPAADLLAWTLGTHGIHITFHHASRRYSGTYLPEVPPAQGWTKEEAILSLIRKAGYRGKVKVGDEEDEIWGGIRLQTYESRKVKRNWAQYERWKAENGKRAGVW
jgi:AMMECR1 domain-containing protein